MKINQQQYMLIEYIISSMIPVEPLQNRSRKKYFELESL